MYIKIAPQVYIPKADIRMISAISGSPIIRRIRQAKEAGNAVDLTAGKKGLSAFFLRDDSIIVLNLAPETILNRIESDN